MVGTMAKIDDSVKKKVPELRFKGFTDDWEERKVGNFLSESKIKGSDGSVSKKLTVKLWRKGIVPKEEIYKGSSATQYYIRLAGQFMYGKLDFLNQAFGILPKELDGYESTLDSPAFDFKDGINPNFFLEYVCQENFYKYQGNIANGSRKAKRIHADTFFDMPITIPSFEEQEKIGNFFKELDDAIALHQRKLDLLKEQKKGYLQKMFPKNGAKVPELRFAGFADDWEERKLKDVVEKQIKGKAQFEKLAPGEVEYLDTSRLNGGQAILTNGLKDVTLDDILILWDGSKAGTVYHGFEGALGSTLKAYRTSANSKFVYQYLKRHQDNIYNNYRTPNIPHVQKDFLNVFTISVPVSDEQEKIGSFFKELDDTIALHQRKLDLLKEQKKGYLQKMFV